MPIQSINPATGEVVRTFTPLSEEAIQARITLCAEAFREHRELPLEHRALCMRKLATLLEEEKNELARLITLEMGKPISAAEAEIDKCAACCRYYASNAARLVASEVLRTDGGQGFGQSYVQYEPLGVILAIMPWNFPFWQVFRFAVPALMAGNVCLLKHAPSVPQCAMQIESLVRRSGFVRGALCSLLIEVGAVERVLGDERIAAATVTGSDMAGRAIAAQAGYLLKKTVLELGGSDPFLVMPSANLDRAVAAAVRARTLNAGQSCIAAKRFILHRDIYDEFQSRFVAGMNALRIDDPMKPETEVGPLSSAKALQALEQQVRNAVAAGGRILAGGERIPGKGYFFRPTVLSDVPRSSSVYREEIFGPVAILFRAGDLSEAIQIANDTPYGLGVSVWTEEPGEQQKFIHELEAGMVFLNSMVVSHAHLPFGGIKRSGYGRELGAAGMREFMNAKTVVFT